VGRLLALTFVLAAAALAAPAAASAAVAELSIEKTGTPAFVDPGDHITYTITVDNAGPDPASDVDLTDVLPPNTSFVSFTAPAGWTSTTPAVGGSGTVTSSRASLAVGQSTFTLVVSVDGDAGATSTIFNTATVSATTSDSDSDDNSSTAATDVSPQADLAVSKDDAIDPVEPGANIDYTLFLTNNGPNNAHNVSLSDALPSGTTFVSATQTGGAQPFTLTTPAVGGTGTVTATSSTLARQDGATFRIVVKVDSGAAIGTTISNTASASSADNDTEPANNSDTETTAVNRVAELSVTKDASPNPVRAGNDLTYNLTVKNSGPGAADSVSLTDAVPAGTTFVSASQTAGPAFTLTTPAAGATGTVTASRSTLSSGATASFSMVVHVPAGSANGSTITNTANVDGATLDSNSADDSASTETTVSNPSTVGTAFTPVASRNQRITIGDARMRLPSGVVFVPLTCEFSPRGVCVTDVTIRFDTKKNKIDPITVRNVQILQGESLDLYVAGTHAQRVKMRRIRTIPITVLATNPPESDVSKPGVLRGLRVKSRR
jgi:uncharacterized repeat protein (TIGR01451 family)